MRYYYFKTLILLFITSICFSQSQGSFWQPVDETQINQDDHNFYKAIPTVSAFYKLDIESLSRFLDDAPSRLANIKSDKIIYFPMPDGDFQSFRVMQASVMTPELQDRYPEIRSFVGKSIQDPSVILRFSLSNEKGLSSMVLKDGGTVFIEPYQPKEDLYISFINSKNDPSEEPFECYFENNSIKNPISDEAYKALRNADDGSLRTFRLALSCTVEYAQFHGGTLEDVMAAMNTTMTRVNGIYERDMGLTMVMVPNESIIFLGPNTNSDPFSNFDVFAMLGQNQQVCDDNIGSENYDIGHVFGTGGGGVAALNSPCTSFKANGVTGQSAPVGDTFDVDYVAHEMGHQYGGNHTQNNNCNRSAVSVEPGSASTIMGYAGICSPNVQINSDDYFHGENIKEMWLNISQGNSTCAEITATANSAPIADAGFDYFIPKSTPFILKGKALDANADDLLTYTWEQNDRNPAPMPPQPTSTVGPAFRSLTPSTSPNRFMPSFSTVLSGSLASTWEVVPSVARTMSFLLTVRDNSVLVGNTSSDEMIVTTIDTEPFEIQTPPTWAPGSTQTVTWTVGESDIAPINCETVNIYFSDNGVDFSTELVMGVPNSGSAEITFPNIADASDPRLLIEAADHIFYTVSETLLPLSQNSFTVEDVSIFPNPSKGKFSIQFGSSINTAIELNVFDIRGRVLLEKSYKTSGKFNQDLDLQHLASGVYLLKIGDGSRSLTKKIIIE